LLHRYGNVDYVMTLPIYRATKLIRTAQEEQRRELIFRLYLADRPYLKDNMSFDDYYEKACPTPVAYDMRDKDVLMKELLGKEG
jgi:hypothetical protein